MTGNPMHGNDLNEAYTETRLAIPTLTEKELQAIAREHTEAVYRYPECWPTVADEPLAAGVCVTCRQPWDRTYGCPTRKAAFALMGRQLEAERLRLHVEELTGKLGELSVRSDVAWLANESVLEMRVRVVQDVFRVGGPQLLMRELERIYREFDRKWRDMTGRTQREAAASALSHGLADLARAERRRAGE